MKENDYFLNYLQNPTFSSLDFNKVGLNTSNTSIENIDTYKNLDFIQNNPLLQTDGKFDESKFKTAYENALFGFNSLAKQNANENIINDTTFFRNNTYAPDETKSKAPEFVIRKTFNPDRQKQSFNAFGIKDAPQWSQSEIAQTQKVWDPVTQTYQDSPNEENFFKNFFKTRVLATWDFDADEDGNKTTDPDKIVHKKGSPKYNENGTYFYEDLGDRDIYGKQVLSKWDTLTEDGSAWNKYDFFDSDDKEKSIFGTIVKNAVKVAPAFIPGVSTWYIGSRVGLETADLMAKLTKIFTGSDNRLASQVEGFAQSFNFGTSDYAKEHAWSIENLLNMSADVFTQLAEQRWLFEKAPQFLTGSKLGVDEKAQKKFVEDLAKSHSEKQLLKLEAAREAGTIKNEIDYIKNAQAIQAGSVAYAQSQLQSKLKNMSKIGEYLSKAYMTGITVADGYGEAKQSGLTDFQAALFTLGWAAGEYGILNTSLGEHILPELRAEKQRMRRAIDKVVTEGIAREPERAASKTVKENWIKRMFGAGKKAFQGEFDDMKNLYQEGKGSGKLFGQSVLANALGEGIEEVSEEALQDATKTIYNLCGWISGDNKLERTWDREGGFKNTLNDYALNFVGGFIGGGLGQVKQHYQSAKNIMNMNKDSAFEQLVYEVREGHGNELKKIAKKMNFGSNDLTYRKGVQFVDGEAQYQAADENNVSINTDLHNSFYDYVDKIENLLEAHGGNISDERFLDEMTLKDLRFGKLKSSVVASGYIQDFNTKMAELISVSQQINTLENKTNESSDVEGKKQQLTDDEQVELNKLKSKKLQLEKFRDAYLDGTIAKEEFIPASIFEMNDEISSNYILTNKVRYIEAMENKPITEIPKARIEQLSEEWDELKKDPTTRDSIMKAYQVFKYINDKFSDKVKNHSTEYFKDSKESNAFEFVNSLQTLNDIKTSDQLDTYEQLSGLNPKFNVNLNRKYQLAKLLAFDLGLQSSLDNLTTSINTPSTKQEFDELPDDVKLELFKKACSYQILSAEKDTIDDITNKTLQDLKEKSIDNILFNEILLNPDLQSNVISEFKKQNYLKRPVKLFLSDLLNTKFKEIQDWMEDEETPELEQQQNIIISYNQVLDKLTDSPIDEFIDDFQLAVGDNSVKASELLTKLHTLYQEAESSKDLSRFSIGETEIQQIQHLKDLTKLIRSHVNAARTNNVNYGSIYGFNATVNELTKTDLAEINDDTANLILQDIYKTQVLLDFYENLYNINVGNKLKAEDKIAVKIYSEFVNKLFKINIPDDWAKAGELKAALNNCGLLKSIYDSKSFNLSEDEHKQALNEFLNVQEALYNFFNDPANIDKVKDPEQLSKLISADNFKFIQHNSTELKANSDESISDHKFVWLLARSAAINAKSFYKEFGEILPELGDSYAALFGQESALHSMYAFYLNQPMFENFMKAYNASLENAVSELTEQQLKDLGDDYELFIDKVKSSHFYIHSLHSFLVEGVPGAGKSSAVTDIFLKMLNKYHPESLENVWIVSTSVTDAEDWSKKFSSLAQDKVQHFDKSTYLKKINESYQDPTFDEEGKIINGNYSIDDDTQIATYDFDTEDKLNKSLKRPTLILIDECTRFSEQDNFLSERFQEYYKTSSILFGDYSQIGARSVYSVGSKHYHLYSSRNNFAGSLILGSSMRTDNILKDENNSILRNELFKIAKKLLDGNIDVLHFKYHQDESGNLYGDKVINSGNAIEEARKLLKTCTGEKETLTYIGPKKGSLYEELNQLNKSGEFKDKIRFTDSVGAQGKEGKYYIINTTPRAITSTSEVLELYTNITRGIQGTLIVEDSLKLQGSKPIIQSEFAPSKGTFALTPEAKKESAERRKNIINSVLEGQTIEGTKLIKENSEETSEETSEAPAEDTEPETPPSSPSDGSKPAPESITPPVVNSTSQSAPDGTAKNKTSIKPNKATLPVSESEYDEDSDINDGTLVHEVNINQRTTSIENNDPKKFNVALHTTTFQRTGLLRDKKGNYYYTVGENDKRIDDANGLIKLLNLENDTRHVMINGASGKCTVTPDTIALLQQLRSVCTNKNESDIIKYLKQLCKDDTADFKIKFGYEQDNTLSGVGNRLTMDITEGSVGQKTSKHKGFVMYIFKNNGKNKYVPVISMSIANFSNVESLTNITDKNGVLQHPDIRGLWLRAISGLPNGGKNAQNNYSLQAYENFMNLLQQQVGKIPFADHFLSLCKLWVESDKIPFSRQNCFIPLDNLMPHQFIHTGPIITNTERGRSDQDIYSDGEYQSIEELKKKYPGKLITNVYTLTSDSVADEKIKQYFMKGHPFVLVGDGPFNSSSPDTLIEEYIHQRQNPNLPQTLSLYYITSPMGSLDAFFKEFIEFKRENKKGSMFGNILTNFEILDLVLHNPKFDDFIKNHKIPANQSNFTDHFHLIKEGIDVLKQECTKNGVLDTNLLIKYLQGSGPNKSVNNKLFNLNYTINGKQKRAGCFKSKTYTRTFKTALSDALYMLLGKDMRFDGSKNDLFSSDDYQNFQNGQPSSYDERIQLVSSILQENSWNGVYFKLPLEKGEIYTNGNQLKFAKNNTTLSKKQEAVLVSPSGKPDGPKGILLNGKLDTTQLVIDVVPIVNEILNKRSKLTTPVNPSNPKYTYQSSYFNLITNGITIKQDSPLVDLNSIIDTSLLTVKEQNEIKKLPQPLTLTSVLDYLLKKDKYPIVENNRIVKIAKQKDLINYSDRILLHKTSDGIELITENGIVDKSNIDLYFKTLLDALNDQNVETLKKVLKVTHFYPNYIINQNGMTGSLYVAIEGDNYFTFIENDNSTINVIPFESESSFIIPEETFRLLQTILGKNDSMIPSNYTHEIKSIEDLAQALRHIPWDMDFDIEIDSDDVQNVALQDEAENLNYSKLLDTDFTVKDPFEDKLMYNSFKEVINFILNHGGLSYEIADIINDFSELNYQNDFDAAWIKATEDSNKLNDLRDKLKEVYNFYLNLSTDLTADNSESEKPQNDSILNIPKEPIKLNKLNEYINSQIEVLSQIDVKTLDQEVLQNALTQLTKLDLSQITQDSIKERILKQFNKKLLRDTSNNEDITKNVLNTIKQILDKVEC